MTNETSLARAARLLALGAGAILFGLSFCGCQTHKPPDGWESPPVKYSVMPQAAPVFGWMIGDDLPPVSGVRLEWDYPETLRSNIVFRVYGSEQAKWDTNWTGWYLVGETPGLEFRRAFGPMPLDRRVEFFTVTAKNTLTGLESDPARRE